MKAITRKEKIMSGENLTPITRKEMFLAKAAGMDIETPEPITREEMFLSKIGGSGGGSAVLTELVVTENGVYDEPVIGGDLEHIIWDGVIGDKVTAPMNDEVVFVKVGDKVLSKDDLVGGEMAVSTGQNVPLADEIVLSVPGGTICGEMMACSVSDPTMFAETLFGMLNATINFTEAGTYFMYSSGLGMYTASITFQATSSTPADGWNKVTVNVAGDIIDVAELPTENIEEGKIYRVTNGDIVTYGIPNAHPVKRFVDGAWVELA